MDTSLGGTSTSSHERAEARGKGKAAKKPPPAELRYRRSSASNASVTTKNKKKKRRWRWMVGKPRDLTMEQEQVFMTMKLRKLNRALTGTKTKRTRFQYYALLAYFVLAFGVVSYTSSDEEKILEEETGSSNKIIVLDLNEIFIIMLYILVVMVVTSVFRESKFITLLYWMFIYIPLAFMIVSFILDDHGDWGKFISTNPAVAITLIIVEMLVLVAFLTLYKLYPRVVQSNWFRRKKRAGIFWRIKVISDWTMTYVGSWGQRFTCKYDGETNEQGLPHGFGRWLDDSFAGEVLTGTWINGIPVAPFASRQFGTGDAFKAVRIGYLMASDDEFTTTKFWPTNEKPPRIGMCSVECSISGSFYNELPLATHLTGPHWLDETRHNVAKLCRQLTHVDDEEERVHQVVQIKASDPRGVQVRGHVYGPTGESFHAGTDVVVVHVDKEIPFEEQAQQNNHRKMTPRRSLNFMPRASRQNWRSERIIVCDESDSGEDTERAEPAELHTVLEEDSQNLSHSHVDHVRDISLVAPIRLRREDTPVFGSQQSLKSGSTGTSAYFTSARSESYSSTMGYANDMDTEMGSERAASPTLEPFRMANASLRIQDWIPAPHKDALIFFPGYKVPLKNALEALGQFIAMTRLDSRVYPIIFGWPCGQRFTYHSASRRSATNKNRENLLKLLTGLQAAGIRNVHFMSHSMGAQTLLGAFDNKSDETRSDASLCFQLDPDFFEEENGSNKNHHRSSVDRTLMICRTITMLNPDFPLEAFVNRSFHSIRRICSTVTIIGDRHDKALWLSQFINGVVLYCGYKQPEALQPKPNRRLTDLSQREVYQGKYRMLQQVIGFSIGRLYFPDDVERECLHDPLLFKERAPVVVCSEEEPVGDRAWLDLDVIDTTGLDTNIAGIRHSGFNLNPILLKDLEELISTGRRAINRATLLYREGNQFSYCHAPSYVAM